MTDDVSTYLRALCCGQIRDVDEEHGEHDGQPPAAEHARATNRVSDVLAPLRMAGRPPKAFRQSAPCPLDGQGNGLDGRRSCQKRSYTNWWLLFNASCSHREGAPCKDSDRQGVLVYQDHR